MIYKMMPKYGAEETALFLAGWLDREKRPYIARALYTRHRNYLLCMYDTLFNPHSDERKYSGNWRYRAMFLRMLGSHTRVKADNREEWAKEMRDYIHGKYTTAELEGEFYHLYCKVLGNYLNKRKPKAQLFTYVIKFLMYEIRDWTIGKMFVLRRTSVTDSFEEDMFPREDDQHYFRYTDMPADDWLFCVGKMPELSWAWKFQVLQWYLGEKVDKTKQRQLHSIINDTEFR